MSFVVAPFPLNARQADNNFMADMIVYDTKESRSKMKADYERFLKSVEALKKEKIIVKVVLCSSVSDVKGAEASDYAKSHGLEGLPVAEYEGVALSEGKYPSDSDLANFLEVPEGVLSVGRDRVAFPNEYNEGGACVTTDGMRRKDLK